MSRLLHVITCISNPANFKSRYKLYKEFEKRMLKEANVRLWTVELAIGDQEHQVTDISNPYHLQVRGKTELWHKENLLNLMARKVPKDGNHLIFCDADVAFMNPNWVEDTMTALEKYEVVQMFQHSVDLGPNHALVEHEKHVGIAYLHAVHNVEAVQWEYKPNMSPKPGASGHPGYAWGWRRSAFDHVGGLYEHSVVGLADWNMAAGLMSDIRHSIVGGVCQDFTDLVLQWGEKAKDLNKNVGYVPGTLAHYWHGPKARRGYLWRNSILSDHQVNPVTDLYYNKDGVLELCEPTNKRQHAIRDALHHYHRSRDEDCMEETSEQYC